MLDARILPTSSVSLFPISLFNDNTWAISIESKFSISYSSLPSWLVTGTITSLIATTNEFNSLRHSEISYSLTVSVITIGDSGSLARSVISFDAVATITSDSKIVAVFSFDKLAIVLMLMLLKSISSTPSKIILAAAIIFLISPFSFPLSTHLALSSSKSSGIIIRFSGAVTGSYLKLCNWWTTVSLITIELVKSVMSWSEELTKLLIILLINSFCSTSNEKSSPNNFLIFTTILRNSPLSPYHLGSSSARFKTIISCNGWSSSVIVYNNLTTVRTIISDFKISSHSSIGRFNNSTTTSFPEFVISITCCAVFKIALISTKSISSSPTTISIPASWINSRVLT